MAEQAENTERPAKRQRLSPTVSSEHHATDTLQDRNSNKDTMTSGISIADTKEIEVGITEFVSQDVVPFQALFKTRYTDFLVNEILPGGEVVHLTDTSVPKKLHPQGPSQKNQVDKNEGGIVTSNSDPSNVDAGSKLNGENVDLEKPKDLVANESLAPKNALKPGEVSAEDRHQLVSYLNEHAVNEILDLYSAISANPSRKAKDHAMVRTAFTNDRSIRTEIHSAIRRMFASKIESTTDKDGSLCLTAANTNTRHTPRHNGNERPSTWPGKLGWLERGGEYLHFTLCKENKDTMESISFLVRQLKTSAKAFQFAGTKDRRAVTSQRVSVHRIDAERLVKQNYQLRNAAVGDFEYKPAGLELGDLGGNEFVLTLRECVFPSLSGPSTNDNLGQIQSALERALTNLYTKGYHNYYGLQRFGTFSTRTDTIGLHILKNDFRSACEAILHYNADALAAGENVSTDEASISQFNPQSGPGKDDILRAKAIHMFEKTSNAHKSLEFLPRKFTAENQIMRHLARSPTDYIGALLAIPRNLRLMYVHAYQSLIWNKAVTNRWQTLGNEVVEGDLVLVREHKDKERTVTTAEPETGSVDADGEIIIAPSAHDRSSQVDDVFDRARPLTAIEASSGQYSIFDVVLPLPGYDIEYPANSSGEFYKTFMGSEEGGRLDPNDMRRKQRDFSLSGGYRKVLARIGQVFSVEVHRYARDEEQFVETDLERVKARGQEGRTGREVKQQDQQQEQDVTKNEGKTDGDDDVKMADGATGGILGEVKTTANEEVKDKVAAVLKFQLGASQYATMVLRELSRGGVVAYKADLSGGR